MKTAGIENISFFYHNLILFSEKNYEKQAKMFYQNNSLALATYSWNILQFNFKKSLHLVLDCLIGINLTSWYIGFGLEKYLNYITELGLILWYVGVRVEKYLEYLEFGLILWYIGFALEKHLD